MIEFVCDFLCCDNGNLLRVFTWIATVAIGPTARLSESFFVVVEIDVVLPVFLG